MRSHSRCAPGRTLRRGGPAVHETIRQWCAMFGSEYARWLRHRQLRPGDKWHLDEVFLTINDRRQYLWRVSDLVGRTTRGIFRDLMTDSTVGAINTAFQDGRLRA